MEKATVSCTNALSDELLKVGEQLAKEDTSFRPLRQGTYCACGGLNYETLAEIENASSTQRRRCRHVDRA